MNKKKKEHDEKYSIRDEKVLIKRGQGQLLSIRARVEKAEKRTHTTTHRL